MVFSGKSVRKGFIKMANDPMKDSYEPLASSNMDFSDKSVRMGFIRKVYMILMAQLAVTFAMIAVFTFVSEVKEYVRATPAMFYAAVGVTLACMVIMICVGSLCRRTPYNYIFLSTITLLLGFSFGTTSSLYTSWEVLMAFGITIGVVLALTLFAFQTKYDFTGCSTFVLVSFIILLMFAIFALIFRNKVLNVFYSALGALLFSFYLVYDTQLMIGGNSQYSISPEDYVFAVLHIYLDIILLFNHILNLLHV